MGISWLICGGESGPGARPFDLAWARATIAQCKAAGVPCFVKQLGRVIHWDGVGGQGSHWNEPGWSADIGGKFQAFTYDKAGGEPSEWPEDLRVREWPA